MRESRPMTFGTDRTPPPADLPPPAGFSVSLSEAYSMARGGRGAADGASVRRQILRAAAREDFDAAVREEIAGVLAER
jgi:hypothetical protein